MSWGKDPTKWGKQVAVRFTSADLVALDRLVAKRNTDRESGTYWSRGWQPKATRSSVVIELVRKADGPQASDSARAPSDAARAASGADVEETSDESAIAKSSEVTSGRASDAAQDLRSVRRSRPTRKASDSRRRRASDASGARGASTAASDAARSRRVRRKVHPKKSQSKKRRSRTHSANRR